MKRAVSFGETKRSWLDNVIAWVRVRKIKNEIQKGAKILDLGCGYKGELLCNLVDYVHLDSRGVDLSVDKVNSLLIQGKVDAKLPFTDRSFDIVTALAIIEHVDYPEIMLSEILRVLKPGGKVLITTPSLMGKIPLEILAKLGLISKAEIDDHKRYYTRSTLKSALQGSGLRSVKVKHFGIMYLNLFARAIR